MKMLMSFNKSFQFYQFLILNQSNRPISLAKKKKLYLTEKRKSGISSAWHFHMILGF